jgi:hypothetical protein
MTGDVIVDEVRRVREGLARKSGFDLRLIFAALRTRESAPDPLHPLAASAKPWTADQFETPVVFATGSKS